jgi:hypothetical protein
LVLGTLLVAGCNDGKLARYPVTGTVLVDGRPAEGAMVIFCPVGGSEELQKQRPFAFTGPDGRFELTTYGETDGCPSGEYKVLLQWPSSSGDPREGARSLGPDRFQGRFMDLETTQLTATVENRATDLPPFDLKTR